MIGLNLVLLAAAGLMLARLLGNDATQAPPSWAATALGFLLATALDPGFVPRYHLSAYSETSVTVALAGAGLLAARLVERVAAERAAAGEAWLLALLLAALVNIKQESVALVVAVLGAGATIALFLPAAPRRRALVLLLAAALPAALLYLAWRGYVLAHFAVGGELKALPLDQWQIAAVPQILASMARIIAGKGVFFATIGAVFVLLGVGLRRYGWTLATRLAAILAGSFVIYDAALVYAYVAHFPGAIGAEAHSYFRYCTHLALLAMAALAVFAQTEWRRRRKTSQTPAPGSLGALLALAVIASPILFIGFLRFDLEAPQLRLRALAQEAGDRLQDGERLALLLPGDNGSVAPALETALRDLPPRRPGLELRIVPSDTADVLAAIAGEGYRLALDSCTTRPLAGAPAGVAALFAWDGGAWRAAEIWPYAAPPPQARWAGTLANAALCL